MKVCNNHDYEVHYEQDACPVCSLVAKKKEEKKRCTIFVKVPYHMTVLKVKDLDVEVPYSKEEFLKFSYASKQEIIIDAVENYFRDNLKYKEGDDELEWVGEATYDLARDAVIDFNDDIDNNVT